jgi:membrane protein implicated in regulation of membrane protease activity
MQRGRAAVVGLGVIAVVFGTAMLMRIVSRLLFALSYLLEALGVLALSIAIGWLVYRVLAGDSNNPRQIDTDGFQRD